MSRDKLTKQCLHKNIKIISLDISNEQVIAVFFKHYLIGTYSFVTHNNQSFASMTILCDNEVELRFIIRPLPAAGQEKSSSFNNHAILEKTINIYHNTVNFLISLNSADYKIIPESDLKTKKDTLTVLELEIFKTSILDDLINQCYTLLSAPVKDTNTHNFEVCCNYLEAYLNKENDTDINSEEAVDKLIFDIKEILEGANEFFSKMSKSEQNKRRKTFEQLNNQIVDYQTMLLGELLSNSTKNKTKPKDNPKNKGNNASLTTKANSANTKSTKTIEAIADAKATGAAKASFVSAPSNNSALITNPTEKKQAQQMEQSFRDQINHLKRRLDNTVSQQQKAEHDLAREKQQINEFQRQHLSELGKKDAQITSLENTVRSLTHDKEKRQADQSKHQSELTKKDNDITALSNKVAQLSKTLSQNKTSLNQQTLDAKHTEEKNKQIIETQNNTISELQNKVKILEAQLVKQKSDLFQTKNSHSAQIDQLQLQLDRAKLSITNTEKKCIGLADQLGAANKAKVTAEERSIELSGHLDIANRDKTRTEERCIMLSRSLESANSALSQEQKKSQHRIDQALKRHSKQVNLTFNHSLEAAKTAQSHHHQQELQLLRNDLQASNEKIEQLTTQIDHLSSEKECLSRQLRVTFETLLIIKHPIVATLASAIKHSDPTLQLRTLLANNEVATKIMQKEQKDGIYRGGFFNKTRAVEPTSNKSPTGNTANPNEAQSAFEKAGLSNYGCKT